MAHYIFLCEFIGNSERKMLEDITSRDREFNQGPQGTVMVREIKLYDFSIPKKQEELFKKYMSKQHIYEEGEFGHTKILTRMIRRFSRLFGLKDAGITQDKKDTKRKQASLTKFFPLGIIKDYVDKNGMERY